MSTDRDYVRRDRPSRREADDEDDDYDIRRRRPRYDRDYSRSQDEEHLRILSILFYVLGGLGLLGGLVPLIYVVIGIVVVVASTSGDASAPPALMGFMFILIGGFISLLVLALAACKLYTGYSLGQRKNYMFCFVIACLACMWMLLGVFTIVVLMRPGVKAMFGVAEPAPRFAPEE